MFRSNPSQQSAVIRIYLLIIGLYTLSASVIWGVNTLFLLDAGLELFEVFLANAIFTGSMALFEIPTGVLADTRGRKVSLLLSIAILFLGTLGYVYAQVIQGGLLWFGGMSVILGLGFTFYSGALEAWLVDALKATGFEDQLDRVFARASMVSGGAMLIGSIGGGFLGEINLSVPYLARAAMLVIVFGISFFSLKEIGFSPRKTSWKSFPKDLKVLTRDSIQFGWKNQEIRLLILAGMTQAFMLAWGFYAWQPYFLNLLGREVTWVAGVIAAFISLSTIAGNFFVERISILSQRRTSLLIWASGISSLALIGVGLVNSFWLAVPLYLVAMGSVGVITPVKQAYLHQVIPSSQRATVISFDSLLASGGSMVGQSGLGYLSQERSLSTGYITGGLVTLFALPFLGLLRKLGGSGDHIVGKAGKKSVCPAQGLPPISAVESVAGINYNQA